MSETRDQAIRDVAAALESPAMYSPDEMCILYAVEQRQRVLELEAVLRAVLPAVEQAHNDATLSLNTPSEWWEWHEELAIARAALEPKGEASHD
jgi:hypothetical protein